MWSLQPCCHLVSYCPIWRHADEAAEEEEELEEGRHGSIDVKGETAAGGQQFAEASSPPDVA